MPRFDARDPAAIGDAARRLAGGELVAVPTETVYGLGARADDDAAVAQVFAAKGRPADHPLIVHVADAAAAVHFAARLDALAERLMAAFWPGPLTLIVPRRDGVAGAAAGGQASIGLRCPAHAVAHELLRRAAALGVPGVAAPSANRFGRLSPTTAAHVEAEFGPALAVLDGGACPVGIESTIVDLTRGVPVLLRPGMLTPQRIEAAAGVPLAARDGGAPRASGTLASHYAPRARLRLFADPDALAQALRAAPAGSRQAVYSRSACPAAVAALQRRMPARADDAARELFATLRDLDAAGVDQIWVEQPPDEPAWDGVRDRLQRAAAA
ncbi:MAG: L-threonylcarbamoyladenylate synthase [Gammaproteobacteria bacterium]